jgi:hypothetical protein
MPESQWPRIETQLAEVMAQIEERHPKRSWVLISGLAEGADRLAAFVGLARGWKLHAILAFHRTRFEQDFRGPLSVGEFRALLGCANRITEPDRRWHLGRPANEGYDAMGAAMLELSQQLIAIWDGAASRGKGGTIEVIEAARRRAIPVAWVHAAKSVPPKVIPPSARLANPRRQRT